MSPSEAARREDFRAILGLVRPGARVLDIGCGEGALLDMLGRDKQVEGRGLEISPANVSLCLARSAMRSSSDSTWRGWRTVCRVCDSTA